MERTTKMVLIISIILVVCFSFFLISKSGELSQVTTLNQGSSYYDCLGDWELVYDELNNFDSSIDSQLVGSSPSVILNSYTADFNNYCYKVCLEKLKYLTKP